MPPVDRIRALAKEVGYAIGEHGSKERDLDLIAAPWTENAVAAMSLLEHIAKGLNAKIWATETKPLGRFAATIQMHGWFMDIDLSVCPIAEQASQPPAGYKLVPTSLTDDMAEAGISGFHDNKSLSEIYRLILAAAPAAQGEPCLPTCASYKTPRPPMSCVQPPCDCGNKRRAAAPKEPK
jgi:hypothetical protein